MSPKSRTKRERLAHHEAAHAVIARLLGVPCLAVFMFPTDHSSDSGVQAYSAEHLAIERKGDRLVGLKTDGIVSLAGPTANVRLSGDPAHFRIGAKSDIEIAQNAALKAALLLQGRDIPQGPKSTKVEIDSEIVEQANQMLNSWRREAEDLVSRYWPKIEKVAHVLLTADMIAEAEMDRLIAAA